MSKRKYAYTTLYQQELKEMYKILGERRREVYGPNYDLIAGRNYISRSVFYRAVEKKYTKDDQAPDVGLSTLMQIAQALNLKLSEVFKIIEEKVPDTRERFLSYINDDDNMRD